MFTTQIADDITFAYRDTGAPPNNQDYQTLIIIHGLVFHNGTFKKLSSLAPNHNLRLILPNRRLYPGSTPYTEDETNVVKAGTEEERSKFHDKEGEYLAIFVANMIQEHGLPAHRVAVIGWSLGVVHLNLLIGSILRLNEEQKELLRLHVCSFILYDGGHRTIGVENPPSGDWTPFSDSNLAPEQRGSAFLEWIRHYYPHPNLASRDPAQLIYQNTQIVKPLTFADYSSEEISNITHTTALGADVLGVDWDGILKRNTEKALFSTQVREAWRGASFWFIYGDQTMWLGICAAWELEKMSKSGKYPNVPLGFKVMKGANHFGMIDDPEQLIETIKSCMRS